MDIPLPVIYYLLTIMSIAPVAGSAMSVTGSVVVALWSMEVCSHQV